MSSADQVQRESVMDTLRRTRVLAIVRTAATDLVPAIVETLAESGICAVEIALANPGTVAAIRSVSRRNIPGLVLGAGTVLDVDDAAAALDAGATYFVSPAVIPEVIRFAADRELAVFPGAYTPTEVLTATGLGARAVKIFPASAGGPGYIKALLGPLPSTQLVPTGGITLESIPDYLRAGAFAVAIGSPLIGDADRTGDLNGLAARARAALRLASGELRA
jgi:2-dehydro-3-deoxyphosphogluconate aldolase / (4S)-4-hydroxy-2-oxoglutarate aldolase